MMAKIVITQLIDIIMRYYYARKTTNQNKHNNVICTSVCGVTRVRRIRSATPLAAGLGVQLVLAIKPQHEVDCDIKPVREKINHGLRFVLACDKQ